MQPGLIVDPTATEIGINVSGEVVVKLPGQTQEQVVGQIQLANFANRAGLEALGDNIFKETDASGAASLNVPGQNGVGTIRQGFIEASNVNVVGELTNMITAQRAYEMNSKVIQTTDEMYQTITQMR